MLFYQFHSRITAFSSKKCSVWLLSKKLTSKHLAQNDVTIDVLTSCMRSSYTPSYKMEKQVKILENLVRYARKECTISNSNFYTQCNSNNIKIYLISRSQTVLNFLKYFSTDHLYYMSLVMRKPVFTLCEQQRHRSPAHPRSLISTFVVCSLDSVVAMY